ncbi:MAG: cadmium-translocating P-type ATPase [Verrucomicrobia bacterium]|nr:cadmium-translocating P-type ATPase [Verrucomicrobiota bacterium]
MPKEPDIEESLRETTRSIAGHAGVVGVKPVPGKSAIEIEFDPAALSEAELRRIVGSHTPDATLQKRTLRLDGKACEACAIRLEDKVKKIPGVRKATATYIGRVLCLTFDERAGDEQTLLEKIRSIGAKVRPYTVELPAAGETLWNRIKSGSLNEEISVALGLLFLIASFIAEHAHGRDTALTGILYAGAYIFCGQQGVRSAIASIRGGVLDVDVLMVLAAIGAGIVGQPFEGALLLFLFAFSNVLQSYALQRTQKAIHSLLKLRPEKALVRRNGSTELVRVEDLQVGEVVLLRPGEHVPVDGTVVEGSGHVDESSLTGESMPVSKTAGSPLFAGTLNQSGGMEMSVGKRAEDSTLSRMVKLVEEAQAEKSKTQRFLEHAEQYYATGVIAFTALVFLVPFLAGWSPFDEAFYKAMTVMVVASPCALVISTPATVLSAIGGAARRGILIKGGSHLESTAQIDIVAFDKTGTLTAGKPVVTHIADATGAHALDGKLAPALLETLAEAAALESKSEHPLAHAIVRSAGALGLQIPEATVFQSTAGKGAEATVRGKRLVAGSERFFTELGAANMEPTATHAAPLAKKGRTCVWIGSREGDKVTVLAVLALADTLRSGAAEMVARLHRTGVKKVVMLTGDQRAVAESIAEEAGVDEVRAGLLPADKVAAIKELKKSGRVMMVGDGVNDAPALATADIGLAMGAAGTDIAMETADVVLMGDKLENIPLLLGMARHAKRVLIQNLTFAGGVIVVLLIAAFGINLPLPMGVIGHEGSTVLVCLNGLRLLAYKPKS